MIIMCIFMVLKILCMQNQSANRIFCPSLKIIIVTLIHFANIQMVRSTDYAYAAVPLTYSNTQIYGQILRAAL